MNHLSYSLFELRVWRLVVVAAGALFVAHPLHGQTPLDGLIQRCNTGADPEACHDLGRARALGEGGLLPDLFRALTYLDEACRGGIQRACDDYESVNRTGELADSAREPSPAISGGVAANPLPANPVSLQRSRAAQSPDMTLISAGSFYMGSPTSEPSRDDDETMHLVTLTHAFWISTTEVTQAQYLSLTGRRLGPDGSCPVDGVSWLEAIQYANLRSVSEGLSPCYLVSGAVANGGSIYSCEGYRLPTEAEWEYAARAGSPDSSYGPLPDIARQGEAAESGPFPVCGRRANAWGLCDMIGNVWEWVHDGYRAEFSTLAAADPEGDQAVAERVIRGCSWVSAAGQCRAAFRTAVRATSNVDTVGFRLARTAL
jgi:sulfatase modifying factor 1